MLLKLCSNINKTRQKESKYGQNECYVKYFDAN